MPVQNYSINTGDGYEGQMHGLQQTRADISTGYADDAISFGKAVSVGTGERGVKLGGDVLVHGISVRQIDREAATRPSDGTVVFKKGDTLPILHDGRIVVKVADAGQADRKAAVFVNTKTGQFAVAAATDFVEAKNVRWAISKTVEAGALIPVVITNALQFA